MKHLKKYNESKEDFNTEYIKDCFIDFIDKNSIEFNIDQDDYDNYDCIMITIKNPSIPSISDFLEKSIVTNRIMLEHYLDIENCIEKVKLKYNKLKYETKSIEISRFPIDHNYTATLIKIY